MKYHMMRRRNAVSLEKFFRKALTCFETRAFDVRAEYAYAGIRKHIGKAHGKRNLRAYNDEIHPVFGSKIRQTAHIVGPYIDAYGRIGYTRVTRRAVKLRELRALPEFPRYGVLTTAAADNQYFHNFPL
jgi:hypothetical protein